MFLNERTRLQKEKKRINLRPPFRPLRPSLYVILFVKNCQKINLQDTSSPGLEFAVLTILKLKKRSKTVNSEVKHSSLASKWFGYLRLEIYQIRIAYTYTYMNSEGKLYYYAALVFNTRRFVQQAFVCVN
jgi:hypothetical protein